MFILLILLVAFGDAASQSNSRRRPIGAILDQNQEDSDIQQVFSVAITMDNRNESFVLLEANTVTINLNDAFALSLAMCKQMSSGALSIFGSHTKNTFNTMKSYSGTLNLPYVTIGEPFRRGEDDASHVIFLKPYYTDAILRVMLKKRWRTVYYVYNSPEGLSRFQMLLDLITHGQHNIRLVLFLVVDGEHAYSRLLEHDTEDKLDKQVFLDLPTKDCEHVLMREANFTRSIKHHYFLAGLGIQEFDIPRIYYNGGMNITGFRLVDFKNVSKFVEDVKDKNPFEWMDRANDKIDHEALMAADASRVIRYALTSLHNKRPNMFAQLIRNGRGFSNGTHGRDCFGENVLPWNLGNDIITEMKRVQFHGLTGFVAFDDDGFRRGVKLDLLEVSNHAGLAVVGSWRDGTLDFASTIIPERSVDPSRNRSTVRIVTTIVTPPFLIIKDPNAEGNARYEGYCVDLCEKIAAEVGFEYRIEEVEDGKYGMQVNGTSWDGMVGELVRREADLAIAPLTITSDREKVIDFSKPFMSLGISIMVKRVGKESPGVFSFMFPLSYEIWMCVIFAYIGVSVVLFLVSRFSPYEWHIEDNTDGPTVTNNFTIFNSLWFSLGAFMQQGCDIEPRSTSGRIVGSVWWFFTLIIISSYTANLAAFLTLDRMQSPIKSADDLAKQTVIKYGTLRGGSTESFFKTSTMEIYDRMWAFMSANPNVFVSKNTEGVKRVRESNGKYAFLMESTSNEYANQRQPCDTMKVGPNLDSKGYGIGTPLGSPLRDDISLAVLELLERGDLEKLENKWWIDKGECTDMSSSKKSESTSSLELSNVAGIFFILIAGLLLSVATAFLEFLYKSRTEARRRKTSFSKAVKSKAKLSMTGKPGQQTTSYTYAPAAQLISLDGYPDNNTNTQSHSPRPKYTK